MADTPRTENELLTDIFQDGQAPNSITAQDMRDFVVSSKYLMAHGWQFYFDSAYNSSSLPGSARSITGGVKTQITIDGLLEAIGHPTPPTIPSGPYNFWNATTNKLVPNGLNNFGIVRLAFTGYSTSAPTNLFEVELDAGGAYPIIWHETGVFGKGATNAQSYNFIIPLFSGPAFQANGGVFYLTPQSDAVFWDFALTAVQLYAANPAGV